MSLFTYSLTTAPTQQQIHGHTEKVVASEIDMNGDWVSFYDGDGLVLRLPASSVVRVQREGNA